MNKRQVGLLVFILLSCAVIGAAGGGAAFLRRPVGLVCLLLWATWWLVLTLGRRPGVHSADDAGQRTNVALGAGALIAFIVAVPWEYAYLTGPLPRDGPLAWVGLATFAGGIALQIAVFRALGSLYTSRLGIQPGHRLVSAGPYRLVRHPGYLSNLTGMLGMSLALSSLIGLALVLAVVPLILRRIAREEAMLLSAFGEQYQAYMRHTRWRLIPSIY